MQVRQRSLTMQEDIKKRILVTLILIYNTKSIDGLNIKTVLGGDLRDTETYYYQGTLADSRERTNQSDLDISNLKVSTVLSETTLELCKSIW